MQKLNNILSKLIYPGRGIVVGKTQNKNLAIAYFIMGRSENSRNRVFVFKRNKIETKSLKNQTENANLLTYYPIIKFKNFIIVGNGNQTQNILNALKQGKSFEYALKTRNFENDPPIFTPRISALVEISNKPTLKISIIKNNNGNPNSTNHFFFEYSNPQNGQGFFIHTYAGNVNNNTASFFGEPKSVYIPNCQNEFSHQIWNSLNQQNKISLFTEYIDLKTNSYHRIIYNKNKPF